MHLQSNSNAATDLTETKRQLAALGSHSTSNDQLKMKLVEAHRKLEANEEIAVKLAAAEELIAHLLSQNARFIAQLQQASQARRCI